MATSNVQIANFALTMIDANSISSLTEETEEARKVNAVFEMTRDELLEEFPWPFAIKRASLALLATAPTYQYSYAYQIPTDCLRYLDRKYPQWSHRIEEDGTFLTDSSTPNIRYIKKVTDPVVFSAGFASALASRLALALAYSIIGKQTYIERLEVISTRIVLKAKTVQSQSSGTPRGIDDNTWLASRSGGDPSWPRTTIDNS